MKSISRVFATFLTAVVIALGSGTAALATHSYVGGGEWLWGITGVPGSGEVYSHYLHGSACHGATAVGTRTVRVNRNPGQWARANAPRANGNNQSYWRNDC
ncbi:lactococcin 972 family bacteriocin [Nocardiopsis sp. L17-MgMaSL7]|uniref:lactococcin 972 family bacteriocin n=1 Tax=Nocardiopsis sp. L17-MgMaSL7 TaxID=1938893 RepID=UPI000D71A495|nr:lactococcin 972 family bacteriocin [Nocardiopsis sp. L17-MgMaSL7]PWV48603.1 lactococcin 972 family bacteriocin [Nocardiopsis sp. L17-MgMaSL7]